MATGQGSNQGKTAFIEQFLADRGDADRGTVNEAWRAAGNDGEISESLFYKIRSKHGLTGRRGANGGSSEGEKAAPTSRRKARSSAKGSKSRRTTRRAGEARSEDVPSASTGAAEAAPSPGDDQPSSSGAVEDTPSVASAGNGSSLAGGREQIIDEVEAGIDELIFRLKVNGGMPEVEASLRAARRLLTRGDGG